MRRALLAVVLVVACRVQTKDEVRVDRAIDLEVDAGMHLEATLDEHKEATLERVTAPSSVVIDADRDIEPVPATPTAPARPAEHWRIHRVESRGKVEEKIAQKDDIKAKADETLTVQKKVREVEKVAVVKTSDTSSGGFFLGVKIGIVIVLVALVALFLWRRRPA